MSCGTAQGCNSGGVVPRRWTFEAGGEVRCRLSFFEAIFRLHTAETCEKPNWEAGVIRTFYFPYSPFESSTVPLEVEATTRSTNASNSIMPPSTSFLPSLGPCQLCSSHRIQCALLMHGHAKPISFFHRYRRGVLIHPSSDESGETSLSSSGSSKDQTNQMDLCASFVWQFYSIKLEVIIIHNRGKKGNVE